MKRTVSGTRYGAFGRPRCGIGRQERGIRLDQDPLARRHRERVPQVLRVLERQVARERQVVPVLGGDPRHRPRRPRSSGTPFDRARRPAAASRARRRALRDRGSASRCRASSRARCAPRSARNWAGKPVLARCGRSPGRSRRSHARAAARRARRSPRSRHPARPRPRTRAPRSGGSRRPRGCAGGMPRHTPTSGSTRCRHPPARRRSRPTATARSSCSPRRQRLVAVGDLEVRVVVVDGHRERLGRRRPAHVALPSLWRSRTYWLGSVDASSRVPARRPGEAVSRCSTRGNSGASPFTDAPAGEDAPAPGLADRLVGEPAERLGRAERDPQLLGRDRQ